MVLAFEIRNNRLGINEQMSVPADVSFFRWTSLSRRRQEPEAKYLARQFLAAGNTPAVQHPRACRARKRSVVASHCVIGSASSSLSARERSLKKPRAARSSAFTREAADTIIFRGNFGWGGRIRTFTVLINSEVSYRLDHAPAASLALGKASRKNSPCPREADKLRRERCDEGSS
jgi:hypothetical protein